jgi:hypothetical protein
MESNNTENYDDAISQLSSENEDTIQKRIDLKNKYKNYDENNDDKINVFFKSGENFTKNIGQIRNNLSRNSLTVIENNKIEKNCYHDINCFIY